MTSKLDWNLEFISTASRLVVTELGEDCQDRGLPPIDSLYDCTSTTEFIKTYYPKYEFIKKTEKQSSYPRGCYVLLAGDKFEGYFNSHWIGSGHSNSRAICKFLGM